MAESRQANGLSSGAACSLLPRSPHLARLDGGLARHKLVHAARGVLGAVVGGVSVVDGHKLQV